LYPREDWDSGEESEGDVGVEEEDAGVEVSEARVVGMV
jgi:hypothetical protein